MPYGGNLILGGQETKIQPHQEFAYELAINQINDMSLSGSYFVTIQSSLNKGIKNSEVKDLTTNTVQIDVFPRHQLPQSSVAAPTRSK